MTEKIVDADSTWDGTGSLDEHRQKVFSEMKQPGFGDAGKPKEVPAEPADILFDKDAE